MPDDWTKIRRLLWDDNEHIMIAKNHFITGPMKLAGKMTVQPKASLCCGNSFRKGSTRRSDSIARFHTFVIEHDESMPLSNQREMWQYSDCPHTLRVFSGGKSIHTYIRLKNDVDVATWKRTARQLQAAFPQCDKKVLNNPAAFSRLPNGLRIDGDQRGYQTVETTNSRISLKSLTDWMVRNYVIEEEDCHRDREESFKRGPERALGAGGSKLPYDVVILFEARPKLAQIWKQLFAHRFIGNKGTRNSVMIDLVTFAFDSVSADIAITFAEVFYRQHESLFNGSLETHLKEAQSHFNSVHESYLRKLSADELKIYTALNQREQEFFRVCRSLSLHTGNEHGTFFIPQTKFGYRLGLDTTQINRLIKSFIALGILELVTKGTRHTLDGRGDLIRGSAGRYRWKLEIQEPK